ncbi:flagellar biosynthetic protein FliO [Bacillus testis]|uniref:flagellar biosynthetic protein FliO n=1 Tax=Bacillus testis TaxID=1622072 RepID=UPI00067EB34D|nr:flagellar biosynthetic protein FliO [Bacillus testis]
MSVRVKKYVVGILFFCFFFMFAASGYAQEDKVQEGSVKEAYSHSKEPKETKEPKKTESPSSAESSAGIGFSDIFRVMAAFLFVIALLFVLLKFVNKRSKGYQNGKLVQNLGGASLGNAKSIQVVKVGNKLFVVGVGDDVQLLHEMTNKDEINDMLKEFNAAAEAKLASADVFGKWGLRKKETGATADPFTDQLKKQLNQLSANRKALKEEYMKKKGKTRHE